MVHAGDRKKNPDSPGAFVPSSTPIYTATTYLYEETAKLDRVLGRDDPGFCYGRYDNPTRSGLEELLTELESGFSSQVCSSGMMALHVAVLAALTDRRKSVLAANALYGATTTMLTQVLEPLGVEVNLRRHLRPGRGGTKARRIQTRLYRDGDHFESAAARR